MEIGLDIGTSTVKATTKDKRIIFPSVYCKRLIKSVWDLRSKEVQGDVIEGIGHKATSCEIVSKEVKVNDSVICKKIDSIFDAKTVVTRKEIDPALTSAIEFLTDKIAHDILEMHIQLPVRNLGCVQNIVLSGGFSKLQNPYTKEYLVKDSLEKNSSVR